MFVISRSIALVDCSLFALSAMGHDSEKSRDSNKMPRDSSVDLPVTELNYLETGIGPLLAARGFGDFMTGAHGTFIKMPAGFVSQLHTHSEDYYAVVISGVMSNEADAQIKGKSLAPGSYWFQKGNAKHVTKCLSANECVFFISQSAMFDFILAR
jgi:beta-alanine degradation protein BauB